MSETATGVDGRPLSKRGERTRRRLLEAAEAVFAELGYHDASIVKITEAAGVGQGTFYLYFASKKDDLRRARRRPEPPRPPGDDRGRVAGHDARRDGAARLRRVLPLHRRASRALPDHPAGGVRLARDAAAPLRAADERLRRRPPPGDGGGRDRRRRPRAARLGADGHRRARRHALDPLGRARRAPARRPRGARPDRRPHDRLPKRRLDDARVGLLADSPLPPRALDDRGGGRRGQRHPGGRWSSRSSASRGKHIAADDEHVCDLAVAAGARLLEEHDDRSRPRSARSSTTARRGRTTPSGRPRRGSRTGWGAATRTRSSTTTSRWGRRSRCASRSALPHGRARARERPARRRLPRVVPPRLRERAVAVHVQLRRRRGGRAARGRRRPEPPARLATRSPTARSRSR